MRFLMIYSIQIMNFINRRLCHDRYNQAETTGSSVTITFSECTQGCRKAVACTKECGCETGLLND